MLLVNVATLYVHVVYIFQIPKVVKDMNVYIF